MRNQLNEVLRSDFLRLQRLFANSMGPHRTRPVHRTTCNEFDGFRRRIHQTAADQYAGAPSEDQIGLDLLLSLDSCA